MRLHTLTKEEFWNAVHREYPNACAEFCAWVDAYKESVEWKQLFNERWPSVPIVRTKAPKYHELPYALQYGIWAQFMSDLGTGNLFQHPGAFNTLSSWITGWCRQFEYDLAKRRA